MAIKNIFSVSPRVILSLLVIALCILDTASSRVLEEEETLDAPVAAAGQPAATAGNGVAAGQPVGTTTGPAIAAEQQPVGTTTGPAIAAGQQPVGTPTGPAIAAGQQPVGTPTGPAIAAGKQPSATGNPALAAGQPFATGAPAAAAADGDHAMIFYMHDILGGSNPSARAVTGVVTNPAVSGSLPFAKPNGAVIPVNNGVPQNKNNNGLINNNNFPFLTGLSGNVANVAQNTDTSNLINGNTGFSVVNGGDINSGALLQKLMFGTMTVIDDELTEGHELGSGLIGRAQGFYIVSSIDGESQTMAFTAMFQHGGYEDSLSFFGVHRTAVSESHLTIMGGTGKYVNAKGFAIAKTLSAANQHHTDGLETMLELKVYITY